MTNPAYLLPRSVLAPQGLNIRQQPTLKAAIITALAKGSPVSVFDGLSASADGYSWVSVMLPDSREGWCAQSIDGKPTLGVDAPPVQNSANKIGLHIIQGGAPQTYVELAARLAANKTPLATATVLNQPDVANQLRDVIPWVVYRGDPDGNDKPTNIPQNEAAAIEAGRQWVHDRAERFFGVRPNIYIQVTNEVGYDPFDYAWWLGVMGYCEQAGYKAAIFADAVGNPSGDDYLAKWQRRIPALVHAKANGHLVCYHAYSAPGTPPGQLSADPTWYELRYRRIWPTLPVAAQALIFLGEAGREFSHGGYDGVENTVKWASALNTEIVKDAVVVGASLWTAGVLGWASSSIDGALTRLEAAIKARWL